MWPKHYRCTSNNNYNNNNYHYYCCWCSYCYYATTTTTATATTIITMKTTLWQQQQNSNYSLLGNKAWTVPLKCISESYEWILMHFYTELDTGEQTNHQTLRSWRRSSSGSWSNVPKLNKTFGSRWQQYSGQGLRSLISVRYCTNQSRWENVPQSCIFIVRVIDNWTTCWQLDVSHQRHWPSKWLIYRPHTHTLTHSG